MRKTSPFSANSPTSCINEIRYFSLARSAALRYRFPAIRRFSFTDVQFSFHFLRSGFFLRPSLLAARELGIILVFRSRSGQSPARVRPESGRSPVYDSEVWTVETRSIIGLQRRPLTYVSPRLHARRLRVYSVNEASSFCRPTIAPETPANHASLYCELCVPRTRALRLYHTAYV